MKKAEKEKDIQEKGKETKEKNQNHQYKQNVFGVLDHSFPLALKDITFYLDIIGIQQ